MVSSDVHSAFDCKLYIWHSIPNTRGKYSNPILLQSLGIDGWVGITTRTFFSSWVSFDALGYNCIGLLAMCLKSPVMDLLLANCFSSSSFCSWWSAGQYFFFFFVGFVIFNLLNREKINIFGILGIISLQKCNCFFVCHSLMQANMIDKFFFCTLVNSLSNLSRLYLILLLNMCLAHRLNYSNFSTS